MIHTVIKVTEYYDTFSNKVSLLNDDMQLKSQNGYRMYIHRGTFLMFAGMQQDKLCTHGKKDVALANFKPSLDTHSPSSHYIMEQAMRFISQECVILVDLNSGLLTGCIMDG